MVDELFETVTEAVPVHPAEDVPVTVYEPAPVNDPVEDVPPLLHK